MNIICATPSIDKTDDSLSLATMGRRIKPVTYFITIQYTIVSYTEFMVACMFQVKMFYCEADYNFYNNLALTQRRRGPVVGRSLWTRPARVQSPGWEARIIRCKNLALYIGDCESLVTG